MAYRVKRKDGDFEATLRRIAGEQIARAEVSLDDTQGDLGARVHDLRKRCKKMRGLLRLVRSSFDGYRRENTAFRDIARSLSDLRDADALIETYDTLTGGLPPSVDRRAFGPIRARLSRAARRARADRATAERLASARQTLGAARSRAAGWSLKDDGFTGVAGGLGKTWKRARNRMADAWADPTVERMHEWRKRVKYHQYHARLLAPLNPAMLDPHRRAMERLSDLLGDHHDLAVLDERLAADDMAGLGADLAGFGDLVRSRLAELESEAFEIGRVVLSERRKPLVRRWAAEWSCWRDGEGGGPVLFAA